MYADAMLRIVDDFSRTAAEPINCTLCRPLLIMITAYRATMDGFRIVNETGKISAILMITTYIALDHCTGTRAV